MSLATLQIGCEMRVRATRDSSPSSADGALCPHDVPHDQYGTIGQARHRELCMVENRTGYLPWKVRYPVRRFI